MEEKARRKAKDKGKEDMERMTGGQAGNSEDLASRYQYEVITLERGERIEREDWKTHRENQAKRRSADKEAVSEAHLASPWILKRTQTRKGESQTEDANDWDRMGLWQF